MMQVSTMGNEDLQSRKIMSATPTAKKVTPPRDTPKTKLNQSSYVNPSLTVDKSIVNELLLVCGVIGSTVDPNTQQIVPVEDCINWLQDLQRALRRDEDAFRPISLLLGQWKVVEQKLLPLVLSCRYNTPLLLTIVKILVILTKPLSENARNAASMIIDTRRGKTDPAVIREQIKLRDNAIAQVNLLTEYKKLFVHHPSHRINRKSKEGAKKEGGLLSVFVSLLADPLSKTGLARTAEDHLTMELILHLFRNLLCAGDPILKDVEKVQANNILHQELIALFEREMVLDFFLVIGQEMENRENKQYNLLVMEILHHMLKNQDPTLVARSALKNRTSATNKSQKISTPSNGSQVSSKSSGGGSLLSKLKKERQQMQAASSARHSHFAGTLVLQKASGQQRYNSASTQRKSSSRSGVKCAQPMISAKRKTKKHQYFIGSGRSHAIHTNKGFDNSSSTHLSGGPASRRSQHALNSFCTRFMAQCYGPVMKTLKNEFRRDSSRLESNDKVVFFRLVWFFCQWRRVAISEGGLKRKLNTGNSVDEGDKSKNSVGNLIFTMDVFMFNLVLTSADFFLQHKKYRSLMQSVSLYVEMMHLLNNMYHSSEQTEQIMGLGLLNRLFYQSEAIDRLPKLLSSWIPGTFTREYLCDLLELTHVTLKILESSAKNSESFGDSDNKKKRAKKSSSEATDAITRMRSLAAEFDVVVYFVRKVFSNQTVAMFTQLLSQYSINATNINDHIVAFFVRLCKFDVISDQDDDIQSEEVGNVTLEPILFNLPLLSVLNEILNDSSFEGDTSFDSLLKFASTVVRHFARASEKNPLLYVEALFRHPVPHRFCESSCNMYLTKELKMIAVKDLLLEQLEKDENDGSEQDEEAYGTIDDEDNYIEFSDDIKNIKSKLEKCKSKNSEADDEEESSAPTKSTKSRVQSMDLDFKEDNSDIEKELDEEEERWNDRRSFVPKRKLLPNDLEEDEESQENLEVAERDDTSLKKSNRSEPKRIRRTILDDSDDEGIGDNLQVNTTTVKKSSARMLLEDSDED